MKKIILTSFILLSLITFDAYAQKNRLRDAEAFPRNEIYIQYGVPTLIELTTIGNKITGFDEDGYKYRGESQNQKFSGVGGIGYNFGISERFSVGIYGGVSYAGADMYLTESDARVISEPKHMYTSDITNYSGQLSVTWTFFYRGSMELSSAAYAGVSYMDEKITAPDNIISGVSIPKSSQYVNFAYHITALKFRYGEMFGFFAELGFGYRGLVNIGLSIKI